MKKRITAFLLTLFTAATFVLNVGAVEQTADIQYLDEQKSIVMWVRWDVETPSVVFVSPSGAEYDPNVKKDGTAMITAENAFYYIIQNAERGQWRVRYDKGNNTSVEISVHDYQQGIKVDSFTLGQIINDRLHVDFSVSGPDSSVGYNYKISAMINHTGAEKELYSGYAYTGDGISLDLELSSLSTYDKYILKLHVWYDDNGTDIFDVVYSDEFSYTNSRLDQNKAEFELTVTPDEFLIDVEWTKPSYRAESVLIAVFENGASEPAMFDEYGIDEKTAQLSYDPSCTNVDVEFTVKYDGVNASPIRKSIDLQKTDITLPEGTAFNTVLYPMTYKGFAKQPVIMELNGTETELVLDGDGALNINLTDDWNGLEFNYTDSNGVNWKIKKNIFVDRIAPTLDLSRLYDGMTVDEEKITVSGTVLDFSTVTVNGETVSVDANGMFSKEISLAEGENTVCIIAADAVGNESQYTAKIVRGEITPNVQVGVSGESDGDGVSPNLIEKLTADGYWVLIGVSGICLLVIIYALIFWRKEKGGKENEKG